MNWLGISQSLLMAPLVAILKVSAVLGLAWLAALGLSRQSAALRHRVWVAGILGALLLPLLASFVPPRYSASLGEAAARWGLQVAIPTGLAASQGSSAAARPVPVPSHATLPYFLIAIWAGVCSLLALRVFGGLRRLSNLEATSSLISDSNWKDLAAELSIFLDVRRPIRLLISPSRSFVPLTWGLFRATIVLPHEASEWSLQRRRIVLAHELAHVGRHDWLMQMCAEVLCCLYWFNPLAWRAARGLRMESERSCDDAVLRMSVPASDYASELLELVQTLSADSRRWAAALAFVRPSNLERRFEAMLTSTMNRSRLSTTNKVLISVVAFCLLLLLAVLSLPAQTGSNQPPRGWFLAGSKPNNYLTGINPEVAYLGHGSAYLKGKPAATEGFGTLMQSFSAGQYAGQRVRFTASVESDDVTDWAGLWMRVDQGSNTVAFDNMQSRPIKGTTGWRDYAVVLDVPPDSTTISLGVLLSKGGSVWMSNVRVETIGADVPVTGWSATSVPKSPTNLNFEE